MKQITSFFSSITTKQWIIIGIVILALIILILLIRNANKKQQPVIVTSTTTNNSNVSSDSDFPLHLGSQNSNVGKWQSYLNSLGAKLDVDNIWGPLTEAASKQYAGLNVITKEKFYSLVK